MKLLEENDVRPTKYNNLEEKAIKDDVQFLIDRKESFVDVLCPSCGTKNEKLEMTKNGFNYVECSHCTMLYVSPRPTEKILSEFYPRSKLYEVFNTYIFPASASTRKEKIFKPRVEKVNELCTKYGLNTESILEVGSGYGFFLEELTKQKVFRRVVGTEASASLFERSQNKEYNVYKGLLEHLEFNETFDFVASFEVIEHVFNPRNFLNKINSLLNGKGILLLSFPNYDGFDIGMLREHSSAVDHEHLNYFNEKSILMLLEETGYNPLEVYTPGYLDTDIVKISVEKGQVKNSFLRRLLCSDDLKLINKFQQFLFDNNLSSHMIVAAQKK